jgi:FolB domain-containing protein
MREKVDKIIIKDLLVRGIVGINPEERENRQDILINLVVLTDIRRAALSDDIEDAVNYRTMSKRIIEHVETSADFLVEKLATDIARLVLSEFRPAQVTVRVEKPGALRFARSVGIEIVRTAADFGHEVTI